ncbi:MAG: DUF4468 domain-containing protein [Bacteroidota bacterium]|nr:DUF4468 domain-containing protein [Bacteroidota bacterium]
MTNFIKICIAFALILICYGAYSQPLPTDPETGKVSYAGGDTVSNDVKQKDLYFRALKWFEVSLDKEASDLEVKDKKTGELQGTGTTAIPMETKDGVKQVQVNFRVTILSSDSIYTYKITDITYQEFPTSGNPNPTVTPVERASKSAGQEEYASKINIAMLGLEENLNNGMRYGQCEQYKWMKRYGFE